MAVRETGIRSWSLNIKEAMSRSKEYNHTLAQKGNWLGSGKLNKEKIWNTKAKEWMTVVIKRGALRSLGRQPGKARDRGIMCFTKSDRDEYSTTLIILQLTGMCLRKRNLNVSNKMEFSKSSFGDETKRLKNEWVLNECRQILRQGRETKMTKQSTERFHCDGFFPLCLRV